MEPGKYTGIIENQGWGTANSGIMFFYITGVINEALDGQDLDPSRHYHFRIDFYCSDKALARTKRCLAHLGAKHDMSAGISPLWFHPGEPGHQSFVGQEIELTAKVKDNGFMDFNLVLPTGGGGRINELDVNACRGMVIGAPMSQFKAAATRPAAKPVAKASDNGESFSDEVPF